VDTKFVESICRLEEKMVFLCLSIGLAFKTFLVRFSWSSWPQVKLQVMGQYFIG